MNVKNSSKSMSVDQVVTQLRALRLPGMLEHFLQQQSNPAFAKMSFNERLSQMCQFELSSRDSRRAERLFKASGIRRGGISSVENLIFNSVRNLNEDLVAELAECNWLLKENPPSLIVTGATGTGKTWLIEALGKCACEKGISVDYYRHQLLVNKLQDARAHGQITSVRNRINGKKLLIIDDLFIAQWDEQVQCDFLDLIDDRNGCGATIIATQVPVEDWCTKLESPYLKEALIDRLSNYAYRIELKGPSLREQLLDNDP